MTFDFEERQGNLFESITPVDSVVIGVSEDMKLPNKGIFGVFRQKYGNQISQLNSQKKSVGQVICINHGQQKVFYLITRQKSYNKPNHLDVERCLVELRKSCENSGVYNLALPRELGTGLEVLPDKYIKETLFTVFDGWPGKMVMYNSVK